MSFPPSFHRAPSSSVALRRLRLRPLSAAVGRALVLLGAGAALTSAFTPVFAVPTGGNVVSGQVTIPQQNVRSERGQLMITQTSQRAIVEWQGFGIAAGEAVRVIQPAQGVALFRVVGSEPSQIFGSLSASGALFLTNPNGVLFGAGSRVDVGALVASTLSIGNADFNAGQLRFSGDSTASVVNRGSITTAANGYAVLLGQTVDNSGSIVAPQGTVALGAARAATLDVYGNGLLTLTLQSATDGARVDMSGSVQADGGRIQIAALGSAARPAAINVSGLLQAQAMVERNGEIVLTAGGPGASLSFAASATANADGIGGAGGGNVTLRSDDSTSFAGRISARGGAAAGDGGHAEVSAVNTLTVTGLADLSAANGGYGTLLLDPGSIDIHGGGAADNGPNSFTDRYLTEQLAFANVTVATSAATNGSPQNITVRGDANIVWRWPTTLTLAAGRSVGIDSGAVINSTYAGPLGFDAIALRGNAGGANADASTGVQLSENALLQTVRGNINISGTGGVGATSNDGVRLFNAATVRSTDGNITIVGNGGGNGTGNGNRGIVFAGGATVQTTGAGAIALTGNGGSSVSDATGVAFAKGAATVATASGTLTVSGRGGNVTAGQGQGIYSTTAATLTSASGAITLNGSAATSGQDGIALVAGANRVGGAASSGDIALNADRITLAAGSSVQTTGTATLQPLSVGRAIDIGGADSSTTLGLAVAELNRVTAGRIQVGNTTAGALTLSQSFAPTGTNVLTLASGSAVGEAAGAVVGVQQLAISAASITLANANAVGTLAATTGRNVVFNAAGDLTIGSVAGPAGAINGVSSGGTTTLTVPSGRLTLNQPLVSSAAGDALTTASASFTNNVGAAGLQAANGRWRVFSQDPANDTRGEAYDFKRYDCLFNGACTPGIPAAGNGFLYAIQPVLAVTPGPGRGVYGLTPALSAANLSLAGFVDGDSAASSGIGGSALLSTAATSFSSVGNYTVNYGGGLTSSLGYRFVNAPDANSIYRVAPRPLELTPDAVSRTYGNANPTTGSASAGGAGLVNGDTVASVTLTSTATAASHVGSFDLGASNAVFGSGLASNYDIVYTPRQSGLSITARSLTLTPDAVSRVYGNANPTSGSATANAGGLVNGDTVASVALSSSATTASNVGSYGLTAANAVFGSGLASDYVIAYLPRESGLSVTARSLTLTPDAVSRVYGNANPASGSATASVGGLVNGDTVGSVTLASTAGVTSNVGAYGLTASNAVFGSGLASNYTIAYAAREGGLAVTARSLTLTPDAVSRVYGNANPVGGSATANAGGLVNGDSVASVALASSATTASNVGSYALSASNATFGVGAASNYAISYAARESGLTVTARSLTLTPDAVSRVYGNANPATGSATANAGGLVNGDTVGSVALSSSATATSNVGAYTLGASNAVFASGLASNYAIAYAARDSGLAVTARSLTLTPDAVSRVYGNANPVSGTASANAGGLVNGDAVGGVALSSSATAVSNVGGYTLSASNAAFSVGASSNYAISYAPREGGLVVTTRSLTLTPDAVSRVYGNANPSTGSATANAGGLVNGDTVGSVALSSSATATSNVGAYTLGASNAVFASGLASNYAIAYAARDSGLAVTARSLTLTPDAVSRVYGNANPVTGSATANAGGLVNGDTVTGVTLASAAGATSNVGAYVLTASNAVFGSGLASNYTIAYLGRDNGLTVTARSLTLTPDAVSRVYGNANPASGSATANAGGLVNGDSVASVALSSSATVASNVESYGLSASSAVFGSGSASNYTIAYAAREAGLSVTARSLTLTPDAVSRVYGNANAATGSATANAGGLVNGDTVGSVTLASAASATSNVGAYVLTASNAVFGSGLASNYTIAYLGRDNGLTVTARSLTLTPDAVSRVYGNANPLTGSATASAGSLVNGDTVASVTLASAADATSNVGSYALGASNAVFGNGLASNYAVSYATAAGGLSITARQITLTPTPLTRAYGDANPGTDTASVSIGSLVNGDTVTQVSVTAPTALATTNANTTQALLASNAVFGSGLASNYSIAYAPGSLGITTRAIAVAALAGQKTVGQTDPALAYTLRSGTLVNGDTLAGSLSRTAGEAPGVYAIGQGTLDAGANYALSFSGASFSIGGVPVTAPIDRTPPLGTPVTNPLQTFLASLDNLAPTAAGPNAAGECIVEQPLAATRDLIDGVTAATLNEQRLTNRGIRLPQGVVDPCRQLPERAPRAAGTAVSAL